jgi:hypothetical protein
MGLAPRTVLIGDKPYVTREAAAQWRERIEQYADEHGGKIEFECLKAKAAPTRQEVPNGP